MYVNPLSLETFNAWLTVAASFVIFAVVCVPMNNRPLSEKLFVLCIAISTLGASLDRISKLWSAYDLDGSVTYLANVVIMLSRIGLAVSGIFVTVRYLQKKREAVEAIQRCVEKQPAWVSKLARH